MKENVEYKPLTSQYDSALAEVIRMNLEARRLYFASVMQKGLSGDRK